MVSSDSFAEELERVRSATPREALQPYSEPCLGILSLNRVLLRRKLQLGLEILGQPDTFHMIRVRLYGRKACKALGVEPRGQYGLC